MSKPTVLYNGSCPVCRAEIEHYRRVDDGADPALIWRDIGEASESASAEGFEPSALRRRLHVVDASGQLLIGVPAFAHIWDRLPRYRWLAKLVRLPVVRTFANLAYEPLAASLYAWDRRRRSQAIAIPADTR